MPSLEAARSAIRDAESALQAGDSAGAAAILERTLASGPWPEAAHNVLTHNLAGALRQLCSRSLHDGDLPAARSAAEQLLSVPAPLHADAAMLRHRADFFHGAGSDLFQAGLVEEALPCQRRAITLYPCPSYSNNLINTLALLRRPALLSDYCDSLQPAEIAPHLLIACQPKSGSTFLRNVLAAVTGFRDVFLFHASGQNEQDLFFPTLLEFATTPTVTQQHCRASEANVQLLQAFGMRAVVLVRDLGDVIASLRDFYNQGAVLGTFLHPESWAALSPEQQTDAIIDHTIPWHLQFLASWQRAERENRLPILWLSYAELMADKAAAVRRVLSFYSLDAPPDAVTAAIADAEAAPRRTRFNQGISGRGVTVLTAAQRDRLRALAASFPETDFAPYGL